MGRQLTTTEVYLTCVPAKFRNVTSGDIEPVRCSDIKGTKAFAAAVEWVRSGGCLTRDTFVRGGARNGKTMLASLATLEAARSGRSAMMLSSAQYFDVARTFDDENANWIKQRVRQVDLFVIDNLGMELMPPGTTFVVDVLLDLLSARVDAGLPTLVTSRRHDSLLQKRYNDDVAVFLGEAKRFDFALVPAYKIDRHANDPDAADAAGGRRARNR